MSIMSVDSSKSTPSDPTNISALLDLDSPAQSHPIPLQTVLIVGGGGREHAILSAICRSQSLAEDATVFVAPGNGGMLKHGNTNTDKPNVRIVPHEYNGVEEMRDFAVQKGVQLAIIGPEDPLDRGIVDMFTEAGVPTFGPTRAASQIECSKAASKRFMNKYQIPTADYKVFTEFEEAERFLRESQKRHVIKASGLAAGKGVVLPKNTDEAVKMCREMLVEKKFGEAGAEIVVEEFLSGYETSILAFSDGKAIRVMPPAQDHKRLLEFDRGLNTGGMGAFAPSPFVPEDIVKKATEEILQRAVDGMYKEGTPFVGVLYAGVMVSNGRPYALEFNCRFGDPETQVLLPLLDDDFIGIAFACIDGRLGMRDVAFKRNMTAVTVVAVSEGYPEAYPKGREIFGLSSVKNCSVFHAGTAITNGKIVTSGGRVLAVTAIATTLDAAAAQAYEELELISFEGMFYRKDIGRVFHRPRKSEPLRLGILGSTRGTDLQFIFDAISAKMLNAQVTVVISNVEKAGILERARNHNVPAIHIPAKGKTREQFDAEVVKVLYKNHVDLVLLIGFMRIVSNVLIDRFWWRLLNVHPSLLPEFGGGMDLSVHEHVLQSNKKKSGCTIHFIDDGPIDCGPILIQKACDIEAGETPDSLKSKVQALEGQAYIEAIHLFDDSMDFLTQVLKQGYPLPKQLHRFYRKGALSPAQTEELAQRLNVVLRQDVTNTSATQINSLDSEYCFYVEFQNGVSLSGLSAKERHALDWLLRETFEQDCYADHSFLTPINNTEIIEVGPRNNFTSAFSTNAVSIATNCGLKIKRIERFRRFRVHVSSPFTAAQRIALEDLLHDRMTEHAIPRPLETFYSFHQPASWFRIPLLEQGIEALRRCNTELGLAMDDFDLQFYYDIFVNKLKRDPTNVELFDVTQSNSEHSRHWFFRSKFTIDGVLMDDTLMDFVRQTLKSQPDNSVVAFADNSSAIAGFEVPVLQPEQAGEPSSMSIQRRVRHLLLTAETHNFPTGVAPFPGAETGTGGRLRDTHATGCGSLPVAGITAYSVGNLNIPGYALPWENSSFLYPPNLATPFDIELQASNGASDYGNKYGEPVIAGFTRSFGMRLPNDERREYVKPIMFTAGIGFLDAEHAKKGTPTPGMLVVKIGGPAYRIGLGGSAASSLTQGENKVMLDYDAVQRGDAEMENKLNRVVRACVELGSRNPIISIHDQGAAGNSNVLKEIVEPAGGRIELRNIKLGDETLSVLEIWGSEYQENDALLIKPESKQFFESICSRERCPVSFVGIVTGDGRVVVHDSCDDTTPVDLDIETVLGNIPQKEVIVSRISPKLTPLQLPIDLTVDIALQRVLRLLTVGSKRFLTSKVDRCVTGLIAQQQCVGPLHTPLANVAVVASSFFSMEGIASAVGEQPIKGLLNQHAMARLTVAEALTNLVSARISRLEDVKCSANWMWPAKLPGEGAALYDACKAMRDVMIELGVAVDGGKDSLSMAARSPDGELVKAPGTLVVTLYSPVPDISKIVTPDIKEPGMSTLLFVNFSGYTGDDLRLGGSALAQVFSQIGDVPPDLDNALYFRSAFIAVQQLIDKQLLLSAHDVSDGGFLVAALEMAFSGNAGLNLSVQHTSNSVAALFSEEVGLIVEVSNALLDSAQSILTQANVIFVKIGETSENRAIYLELNGKQIFSGDVAQLRDIWEETSFEIEKRSVTAEAATEEQMNLKLRTTPLYKLSFLARETPDAILRMPASSKPKVAIIREEGSNSDREMSAAMFQAGFDPWDVHMTDLHCGKIDLNRDGFCGIVFVGGFSYGDVLDSAKGWAGSILLNRELNEQFQLFKSRKDTFSLGVCNGCQLMALLGWVGQVDNDEPVSNDNPPARFIHNSSGRFQCRFPTVSISEGPSIFLRGMAKSTFGVWCSHGEGKLHVNGGQERLQRLVDAGLAPIVYVDDQGKPTESYPLNPNGSPLGIAALCSPDGRHLAIMPHPERTHRLWQFPWQPRNEEWRRKTNGVSPWMLLFQNAYHWAVQSLTAPVPSLSINTTNAVAQQSPSLPVAAHQFNEEAIEFYRATIAEQIGNTLHDTNFGKPLSNRVIGKVRDIYTLDDETLVLITTDRLSAFDRILTDVPFKGAVLNQVAQYWFENTKNIVPNHFIAAPHANVTIAKRCTPFAVEFVVRGYITGTTSTSLWTHYIKGSRNYCGNELPDGLVKNQKLPASILTPTTKSDEHDRPITPTEIINEGLMTTAQWNEVSAKALQLFEFGQQKALKHGLLLVDTKYEFGIDKDGIITLIDEIHTPDSSRYWIAASYNQRFDAGLEPENIDKEFLRLWYISACDPYKDEVLPEPPVEKVVELSRRYVLLYELITGKSFQFSKSSNIQVDVQTSIEQFVTSREKRTGAHSPRAEMMRTIFDNPI